MTIPAMRMEYYRWVLVYEEHSKREPRHDFVGALETGMARLFRTKRAAAKYAQDNFAYIRHRTDLRREPFCWRMPKPVRVCVAIATVLPVWRYPVPKQG